MQRTTRHMLFGHLSIWLSMTLVLRAEDLPPPIPDAHAPTAEHADDSTTSESSAVDVDKRLRETDEAIREASESLDPVYEHLRALQKSRQELNSGFSAEQREIGSRDSSRNRRGREIERIREELDDRAASRQRRNERLRRQVEELQRTIKEKKVCEPTHQGETSPVPADEHTADKPTDHAPSKTPTEASQPTQHATSPSHSSTSHDSTDASPHGTHESATKPTENEHDASHSTAPSPHPEASEVVLGGPEPTPADHAATDAHGDTTTHPVTSVDEARTRPSWSLVEAIAVTDQPIDRMALADNLYGMGEFAMALQIYEKIPAESLTPSEQIWVEYQIANCHRRQGQYREADTKYRIITSRKGKSWIRQSSLWWLEANNKARTFERRVDAIQKQIELLQGDGHGN